MITGLLLSMVLSGPAMAQGAGQQDARAREMFITGQHLYQEGRYRDALVAFESAYRLSGRPNILRSLAYCHENLGEIERALDVLYRYRGLAEESKIPEIERHIQRLENRLDEAAAAPPVVVAPTNTGQSRDTPPRGSTAPRERADDRRKAAPREIEPREPWRVGLGPKIGFGLGGLALGTGGFFAWKAYDARTQARELCSTGAGYCPRAAAEYINDDAFYSVAADTSFAVGGVALVGATVWMVIHNRQTSSVRLVPFGNGLGLVGSF